MAPSSASSPRGTRGRGLLLNFLPPRAKLSFLWRTIVNDEIKTQREYPRIPYLEYLEVFRSGKCSDWGKKKIQAQAPHVQAKRVLRPHPRPRLYTSPLDPCAFQYLPLYPTNTLFSIVYCPPSSWRLHLHEWRLGTASVSTLSQALRRCSGQFVSLVLE